MNFSHEILINKYIKVPKNLTDNLKSRQPELKLAAARRRRRSDQRDRDFMWSLREPLVPNYKQMSWKTVSNDPRIRIQNYRPQDQNKSAAKKNLCQKMLRQVRLMLLSLTLYLYPYLALSISLSVSVSIPLYHLNVTKRWRWLACGNFS